MTTSNLYKGVDLKTSGGSGLSTDNVNTTNALTAQDVTVQNRTITRRTLNLLPEAFRTDTNDKFLNATLDQLVSPSNLIELNGFIGRTDAFTYNASDNYIIEDTDNRQNYQLEPGTTIKNDAGKFEFVSGYQDLLNQIAFNGGKVDNHDRLFESEFYAYDPLINFDKFVNYAEYYWLPAGPDSVQISSTLDGSSIEFNVTNGSEFIFTINNEDSRTLTLARGNTYKFHIDSDNIPFYIKTDRSVGVLADVYNDGITNNGTAAGILEFTVPTDAPELLYYQSPFDLAMGGTMHIVDAAADIDVINISRDIEGSFNFVSSNGTVMSSGLKVQFDDFAIPESYRNNEYYVENAGEAIRLIAVRDLITPETYTNSQGEGFDTTYYGAGGLEQTLNSPIDKDYIIVERGSKDNSPWSRHNRWFHKDIILQTATANNTVINLDQTMRATRPIIEFKIDHELFNFGRVAKASVNLLDTVTIDVFSTLEGASGAYIDGVELLAGMRVIFVGDQDPDVRDRVFEVSFIDPDLDGNTQLHFALAADSDFLPEENVLFTQGLTYQGVTCRYESLQAGLVPCQSKIGINQPPRFNVYDSNGISFGEETSYDATTFQGTTIFEYAVGTGTSDTELGFPLTYRNFGNIGDIVFNNTFTTDTFAYQDSTGPVTVLLRTGRLHRVHNVTDFERINNWTIAKEKSKQSVITHTKVDITQTQKFQVLPTPALEKFELTLKVFVNNNLKENNVHYTTSVEDNKFYIIFNTALVEEDLLSIHSYNPVHDSTITGFYEVPHNLEDNGVNNIISDFTLGEVRNHVGSITNNVIGFSGDFPGSSNLRDIAETQRYGKNIIQHSAGVHKANYLLTDEKANFVNSIKYASKEYTRFKNKFLRAAETLDYSYSDPVAFVDTILTELSLGKTVDFPFYYSDMAPYGSNHNDTTYTVFDSDTLYYEFDTIFDQTLPQNRAILVYLNGVLLIKDTDYTIDTTRAAVSIVQGTLAVNDVVLIKDYQNTDANFIPQTPTKLGLYPKFKPQVYNDTSYSSQASVEVLQGHDGSITPTYGDFRDALLLELEIRIYNNIKTSYDNQVFDINEVVSGKYRDTRYSITEINEILSTTFLEWTGIAGADYEDNSSYSSNNRLSWTWTKFKDTDGEQLLGYYRGIYRYFFDTDRPHSHPWEMLGFTEKPSWWETEYGAAPYTNGNLVLWEDLEQGLIRQGSRQGRDLKYVRPGLPSVIPVDSQGNLIDPLEANIVPSYNQLQTSGNFVFGDSGPTENAWRRSSDYPFAIQLLLAVTKPAKYFDLMFDTAIIKRETDTNQIINTTTNLRPRNEDFVIHSENIDIRTSGYNNIIAEYLINSGVNVKTYFGDNIRALNVNLMYKLGGFSNKRLTRILAEQVSPTSTNKSIFIPEEDYFFTAATAIPQRNITYSGIIVERTANGYSVEGYDIEKPYFTIMPSIADKNTLTIDVGGIAVTEYKNFSTNTVNVPYNTEYASEQQVYDFLISYGRYLEQSGFIFDSFNKDLNHTKNWRLTGKEFLFWSTQDWGVGSVITLSPAADLIKFESNDGTIDNIMSPFAPHTILSQEGIPLGNQNVSVKRVGNRTEIGVRGGSPGVFLAKISVVSKEHTLVFNNETIFSDIIYEPKSGHRQLRLKYQGHKTGSWQGQIELPGYIYNQSEISNWEQFKDYRLGDFVKYQNKEYVVSINHTGASEFNYTNFKLADQLLEGMLPNLDTKAAQFETFYDIHTNNINRDQNTLAKQLIGYQKRQYFENLGVPDVSQIQFYQEFIKKKGTKEAVDALIGAEIGNFNTDITFFEEWAFRDGVYGSVDNKKVLEMILNERTFTNNPETLSLQNNNVSVTELNTIHGVKYQTKDLYNYDVGSYSENLFKVVDDSTSKKKWMDTAGYARLDDVSTTLVNIDNINSLNAQLSEIRSGYTIWVAFDSTVQDWNIYRLTEQNAEVIATEEVIGNTTQLTFVTTDNHGLSKNTHIAVNSFDTAHDGFYKIVDVPHLKKFTVQLQDGVTPQVLTGQGVILKLVSVRFANDSVINNFYPAKGWDENEKIWIDSDVNGKWKVLQKELPYDDIDVLTQSIPANGANFGNTSVSENDNNRLLVGSPGDINGQIEVFERGSTGLSSRKIILPAFTSTNDQFGFSLAISEIVGSFPSQYSVFAGAPYSTDASAAQGKAYVLESDQGGDYNIIQTIDSPNVAVNGNFGYNGAMSDDNVWMFISQPETNQVFAYQKGTLSPTSEYVYIGPITAASSASGDKFGYQVDTNSDGTEIFVSAPFNDTNGTDAGAVYRFTRIATTFTEEETIVSSGITAYDQFGTTMSFDSTYDYLAVGAALDDTLSKSDSGIVYIFNKLDSTGYSELQIIADPDATANKRFGEHVSFSEDGSLLGISTTHGDSVIVLTLDTGDTTIDGDITRFRDVTSQSGSVTIYELHNTNYIFHSILTGETTLESYDRLGTSIHLNDNKIYVGAVGYDREFDTTFIAGDTQTFTGDGSTVSFVLSGSYTTGELTTVTVAGTTVGGTTSDGAAPNSTITLALAPADDDVVSVVLAAKTTYTLPAQFDDSEIVSVTWDNIVQADSTYDSDNASPSILTFTSNPPNATEIRVTLATTDSGAVFEYTNTQNKAGWTLHHVEDDLVDINRIKKLYTFNRDSNVVIDFLDLIDPRKGKIPGPANEALQWKTGFDPAIYNVGNVALNNINATTAWEEHNVGKLWWDTAFVKYYWYEQGDLYYRTNNWGSLFPGVTIDIYEWVRSTELPSAYTGTGTPKDIDDSLYSLKSEYNSGTDSYENIYYYWVKDTTEINAGLDRSLTAELVAALIVDPKSQGHKFAGIIEQGGIILYNIVDTLVDQNIVLHIEYADVLNDIPTHVEWQLVRENDADSQINTRLRKAMFDSLVGATDSGAAVPDRSLVAQNKYGTELRPRQTMFVDRSKATEVMVNFVNEVFATEQIVNIANITKLTSIDPLPTLSSGEYDRTVESLEERGYLNLNELTPAQLPYRVLVKANENLRNLWQIYSWDGIVWSEVKTQTYVTTNYWNYADWYATGFDAETIFDTVVETENDLVVLTPEIDNVIKIKNSGAGNFKLVQFKGTDTYITIAEENATIQLKDNLYNLADYNLGFDASTYEDRLFDEEPVQEYRNILNALYEDIFIGTLKVEFNKFWFTMTKYAMSEQSYVDWLMKTSFIYITHNFRELGQEKVYQRDDHEFVIDYLAEAKPFKTNIREYVFKYSNQDTWTGDSEDFDLPGFYDDQLELFRSPDVDSGSDTARIQSYPYKSWYDNYKMEIGSITIEDAGTGYVEVPIITISGGGGSGATAEAVVGGGVIRQINVTDVGSGYTTTPTVTIEGGGAVTSIARLYAQLQNEKTRSIRTHIKFDRILGTNELTAASWAALPINETFTGDGSTNAFTLAGQYPSGVLIVTVNGAAQVPYIDFNSDYANPSIITFATTPVSNAEIIITATKDISNITYHAADRIEIFYAPMSTMIDKNFIDLMYGTAYEGVRVDGLNFEFAPGFDKARYDKIGFDAFKIGPEGVPVLSGPGTIDTIVDASSYSYAGTDPNTFIVDGDQYISAWAAHAPEEVVPGITFDTIDIRVFDKARGAYPAIGWSIFKDMKDTITYKRVSLSGITTLAQDLNLGDISIVVTDSTILVNPSRTTNTPGLIQIGSELIEYWDIDNTTHTITNFRRGTAGTGAPDFHKAGVDVMDYSDNQKVPAADIHNAIWYDSDPTNATNELGFQAQTNITVEFLKLEPTKIPT